jgi:hypothetical protein
MKDRTLARSGGVAILVAAAICLVPSAAMAKGDAHAAANKNHEAQQDFNIRRNTRTNNHQRALINKLTNTVGDAVDALGGRIKHFEDIEPTLVAALSALQAGLTTVGNGLTTVGNGLTQLGSAYQAVEYGRAAISAGDADLTIAAGGSGTSADIPDDGNTITLDDDGFVVAGAGATNESLNLRALIRSAESDGDTAAKTAGQAGGFIQVANADTGARVPCTGAPNPPGIFGTTAGDSIVTPSGTVTNLPLKNIPGGNLRTSTVEPTGANGVSLLPAACTFAASPGTTYRVHWSVNFVDIPTSTTPGPTE